MLLSSDGGEEGSQNVEEPYYTELLQPSEEVAALGMGKT